ncbi:MAG TPA: tyrosine-type recombinase/integrase [Labilithrix sp.]|nr:tyrosine-type recombinase/integrase [Labilithrix sp.]
MPKRSQKAVLPKEHLEALVTSSMVDEHWRLRYLVACLTGLRDGELTGLTWGDLELWAKHVGWNPRPSDPVFPDRRGKEWRPRSSDRIHAHLEKLKLATEIAGKKIDFHSTRRFFATALARAGVESAIRKRLMGHTLVGDVTEASYIEREMDQLHEGVCRIKLDLQKADLVVLPLKLAVG